MAVHWFDKRYVFLLSTILDTGNVEVRHLGSGDPLLKSIAINESNKFMGRVDYCDQLLSSYSIGR